MKNVFLISIGLIFMISCNKEDEINLASIQTIEIRVWSGNEIECSGKILNSGSKPILEKGFCWSTDSLPNINFNDCQIIDSEDEIFKIQIETLLPLTRYYITAFGTSELGTFYGNVLSFVTDSNKTSHFTDNRDNRRYKTVYINDVEWMAENLSYSSANSNFYDNDSVNYSKYGRLYTWNSAENSCPTGWKLPGDDDWMKLESATGMTLEQITDSHIRGWEADQLLENGIQSFNGLLINDYQSFFWTSTIQSNGAYYRGFMINQKGITRSIEDTAYKFSVRCIRE